MAEPGSDADEMLKDEDSGGDAGGGNVAVSYSYTTFNDLTVMHSGDPNTNYTWDQRGQYLLNL